MSSRKKLVTFWRIIHTGTVNFLRNLSLAIAAMAIMVVTLTIVLFSVIASETFSHTIKQITNKIDISVYLNDSDTKAQTDNLIKQLKALPNVQSLQYLSKAQALNNYEQANKTNTGLIQAIQETSNPIPATIIIKPVNLNNLDSIKNFLSKPTVNALQTAPPSYSGQEKQAI